MKRVFLALMVMTVMSFAVAAQADCGCASAAVVPTTTYYAPATTAYYTPATSASVVTGSPLASTVTAYYPSTVATTAYYAPAAVVEPVTTYYAPAPVTTYYAPTPVTAYYAPTTVYSPVVAPVYTYGYPTYSYYRYRVPGQPIRNLFR
jgi:hypothetical protein